METTTTPSFLRSLRKSFPAVKAGHDGMRRVLSHFDSPQDIYPTIHIAGTNGKGSTSTIISSCLQEAGHKVGLFTGPHLVSINERIRINHEPVAYEILEAFAEEIPPVLAQEEIELSFMEVITVLAFIAFARLGVDVAVIEVGVGGLKDPTNILTPVLSIITPISFDHTHMLGHTIEEIAAHKAGIIKEGIPVVVSPQMPEALEVITSTASALHSAIHLSTPDVRVHSIEQTLHGTTFTLEGSLTGTYTTALLGAYQVMNTITALLALQVLHERFPITEEHIRRGLAEVRWAGRLDVLQHDPLVIAEGAHNEAGFIELANFLRTFHLRPHIMVGFKKEKNVSAFIKHILPLVESCTITKGNFMPEEPEIIRAQLLEQGYDAVCFDEARDALQHCLRLASDTHPLVISGSLYLLGYVYSFWNEVVPNHPVHI